MSWSIVGTLMDECFMSSKSFTVIMEYSRPCHPIIGVTNMNPGQLPDLLSSFIFILKNEFPIRDCGEAQKSSFKKML